MTGKPQRSTRAGAKARPAQRDDSPAEREPEGVEEDAVADSPEAHEPETVEARDVPTPTLDAPAPEPEPEVDPAVDPAVREASLGSMERAKADEPAAPASSDPAPRAYTVEELMGESTLKLGCTPHDVAGALHGCEADKTFTLGEAKALVEEFLTRPVS